LQASMRTLAYYAYTIPMQGMACLSAGPPKKACPAVGLSLKLVGLCIWETGDKKK
jgi:hypothetical protein